MATSGTCIRYVKDHSILCLQLSLHPCLLADDAHYDGCKDMLMLLYVGSTSIRAFGLLGALKVLYVVKTSKRQ